MKVLIVEDERRIAERIERFIYNILQEDEITVRLTSDLQSAKAMIAVSSIDILCLDLNLNGQDGFEILKSMVAESFHTIIISAHKERAIEAFEYGVLDFIPKPFNQDRLRKSFDRLKRMTKDMKQHEIRYLSIKTRSILEFIDIEHIQSIQAAGPYSEILLKNGKIELHAKNLEKLSQLLPHHFVRCHRSHIINFKELDHIQILSGGKYTAILKQGNKIPIGRTFYAKIKDLKF